MKVISMEILRINGGKNVMMSVKNVRQEIQILVHHVIAMNF